MKKLFYFLLIVFISQFSTAQVIDTTFWQHTPPEFSRFELFIPLGYNFTKQSSKSSAFGFGTTPLVSFYKNKQNSQYEMSFANSTNWDKSSTNSETVWESLETSFTVDNSYRYYLNENWHFGIGLTANTQFKNSENNILEFNNNQIDVTNESYQSNSMNYSMMLPVSIGYGRINDITSLIDTKRNAAEYSGLYKRYAGFRASTSLGYGIIRRKSSSSLNEDDYTYSKFANVTAIGANFVYEKPINEKWQATIAAGVETGLLKGKDINSNYVNTSYSLDMSYYPNTKTKISAGVFLEPKTENQLLMNDNEDSKLGYHINADYYITPFIKLGLGVSTGNSLYNNGKPQFNASLSFKLK